MKKKVRVTASGWTSTYEIDVEISFEGCSEEQLREWAMRERVIALQRSLRSRGESYVAGLGGRLEVNAKDIGHQAPVEVLVQKLSPEERQRLLALLQQT